jgi:hypothetical protein
MERKEKAVVNAIDALTDLQYSIGGDPLQSNEKISLQINQFVNRLGELFEESRAMDDMLLLSIPVQLFERLDKPEESNPELFQCQLLEDALNVTAETKRKSQYLDVS